MTARVLVHTAPACDWRVRGRLLERYVHTRIRAINQHAVVGRMHGIDLWTG